MAVNKLNDKLVLIFDFDNTIIEANSDTVLLNLLDLEIKQELISDYKRNSKWTQLMRSVFLELQKHNVKRSDMEDVLLSILYVNGMPDLFEKYKDCSLYIVSDANSWIIDFFLAHKEINRAGYFKKIYTNLCLFSDDSKEIIDIIPYHNPVQKFCNRCPENMCKGSIVSEIIGKNADCDTICYFGDGKGDFCACCNISTKDKKSYAFIRKRFSLELYKNEIEKNSVEVILWDDARDIMNSLQSLGY